MPLLKPKHLHRIALAVMAGMVIGLPSPATHAETSADADSASLQELAAERFNQAEALREAGRYAEAIPIAREALALDEQAYGAEHLEIATDLDILAGLLQESGDLQEARPLFERSLAIRENVLGPDHPDVAKSLRRLAWLLECVDNYSEARPLYERRVVILEKSLGPDHLDVAKSLEDLATLLSNRFGDYGAARAHFERSLSIRENVLGPDHADVSISLNGLAGLLENLGEFSAALPLYERSLKIREKEFGKNDFQIAIGLNALAILHMAMGDYAAARPLYERSLEICEITFGQNHPNTATSLGNLAGLHMALGNYAAARPLYERSLAIDEVTIGPEHFEISASINNLATLLETLGDYAAARPLYERSLAIDEDTLGPDHPSVATSLSSLAGLLLNLGDYPAARPLYERGLAIREMALGPNHPDVAASLNGLAVLLERQEDYAAAHPLYERAVSIGLRHGDVPANLATWRANLARLVAMQGQREQAIFEGKQAINLLQGLRGKQASLDRELRKSFLEANKQIYEDVAGWLIDAGRLGEAQQVLAMLKEDELDGFTRRSGTPDADTTQAAYVGSEISLAKEESELASAGQALWKQLGPLDTRWRQGRQKDPTFALPPAEEAERQRLNAELAKLNERFRAYNDKLAKALRGKTVSEAELARLGDRSDEYRRILAQLKKASGREPVLLQYVLTDERLYILRHDTQRSQPLSVPVQGAEINRQIQALRTALLNPAQDPRPAAQALYRQLIGPVAEGLEAQGVQHLMVSLTGALRYIPLAALHDGKQWLIERYSLSMFSETVTDQLKDRPGDWSLAGFGLTQQVPGFSALPAVRDEFTGIQSSGLEGTVLFDAQFTAAHLRDSLDMQQAPVVHIASHFDLSPGDDARSFLVLGDGSSLPLKDIGAYPFEGVDLFALSACETAVSAGPDANGKEIESLGAIVQRRGAKAVMASLWKVADASTAQLMQAFYAHRQQDRLPKAEALRMAQREMIAGQGKRDDDDVRGARRKGASVAEAPAAIDESLAGYRHPYYWAPFVLMGNWL